MKFFCIFASILFFSLGFIHSSSNFRGIHHIGFTVPNITEAISFFSKTFDCTFVMSLGPFIPQSDWMNTHLNVDANATIRNISFLRCGSGSNLEIFEYEVLNQSKAPANNSDLDGHHIAFYVDNISLALQTIKTLQNTEKITLMAGPSLNTDPASGGLSWIYLTTSWGLQIELVSAPNGMDYEKNTTKRLWSPTTENEAENNSENKGLIAGVIILAITTAFFPIFAYLLGRKKGMQIGRQEPINDSGV